MNKMSLENDYELDNFSQLNKSIKTLLNSISRNIRDEILTGEIKIPFDKKRIKNFTRSSSNSPESNRVSYDSVIIQNMSNEYKLKFTSERKKNLVRIFL